MARAEGGVAQWPVQHDTGAEAPMAGAGKEKGAPRPTADGSPVRLTEIRCRAQYAVWHTTAQPRGAGGRSLEKGPNNPAKVDDDEAEAVRVPAHWTGATNKLYANARSRTTRPHKHTVAHSTNHAAHAYEAAPRTGQPHPPSPSRSATLVHTIDEQRNGPSSGAREDIEVGLCEVGGDRAKSDHGLC
ncbi:hypothetical protein ABZP36_006523 [Zizania latifolia]